MTVEAVAAQITATPTQAACICSEKMYPEKISGRGQAITIARVNPIANLYLDFDERSRY